MWFLWFVLAFPEQPMIGVGSLADCMKAAHRYEQQHGGDIDVLCHRPAGIDTMFANNHRGANSVWYVQYLHKYPDFYIQLNPPHQK